MQGKAPKATNFDALPFGERVAHQVQQVLHGEFNILGRQVLLLARDGLYQF